MQFELNIKSDNAAATDDPFGETVRILREVADRLERDMSTDRGLVRDINGATVGSFCLWLEENE